MSRTTAERWRELHGQDNWRGLLDPLDPDLRHNIIIYGELTQATNDAFIREPWSPHAGASRYGRKRFFDKMQTSNPGLYQVTMFFYATAGVGVPEPFIVRPSAGATGGAAGAWNGESNWMGYVAVATDEGKAALGRRDVVVTWRGTARQMEWLNDLDFTLVPATDVLGPAGGGVVPKVHRGWLSIYAAKDPTSKYSKLSARKQILNEIGRLMDLYNDEDTSITLVGHSLGAAVATLNAIDIVSNGLNRPNPAPRRSCPVAAIVFGSPRVGDASFKKMFHETPDLRLLRICNAPDLVPTYPSIWYVHAGVELRVDTSMSPYLKAPGSQATWHNLECYLHGVAGTQGKKGGFKLEVDRDVALVNKNVDALKDEYHIPPSWRVPWNRGMVKDADGHWKLMDHEGDTIDIDAAGSTPRCE